MPEGWTPETDTRNTAAAPPVSDLPTTTNRNSSLETYTEGLPVTRDPALARDLGEPEMADEEPAGAPLSSMRQPSADLSYLLDNPSTMSPEAYRRLVQAQGGESEAETVPLSLMRHVGLMARRPRRPVPRSEVRA